MIWKGYCMPDRLTLKELMDYLEYINEMEKKAK